MCAHEPGLFTSTMPAMVRPRKTSSETRRLLPMFLALMAGSLICTLYFVLCVFACGFAALRLCVNDPLATASGSAPALEAVYPDQTLPERAASKSSHTSSALH